MASDYKFDRLQERFNRYAIRLRDTEVAVTDLKRKRKIDAETSTSVKQFRDNECQTGSWVLVSEPSEPTYEPTFPELFDD